MNHQDEAVSLSNPRIIAAVYFGVLSVMFTLAFDAILYAFGINQFLPLYQATILADIIAVSFGALFAEKIVHSQGAYLKKSFFWAVLMTITAIPIYDVGLFCLLALNNPGALINIGFKGFLGFYLAILAYSFILCGWWLALVAGFAAMYLRGCIIYYILRSF